jgi:adenine/guanine phosphoribosyltransferase-like PRPP-binding protein
MNTLQQELDDFRRTADGKVIQGASHTCRVLNHKSRNSVIIKAVCDLRKISNQFDSIACCGVSGLMVVPQIAELLDKHIVVIRKKNEKSYSDFPMEGVTPFRYIIVDDLVCSGSTIKHIKNTIHEDCPKAQCVGVYCYMPDECAYRSDTVKMFEKDFRVSLLNPYQPKT